MGLFPNYAKEGPGVDKDAPKKKGFFLFWDILFHKFTKFLGANAMYSLCSILWLAFLYIIAPVAGLSESLVKYAPEMTDSYQAIIFGMRALFAVTVFNLWGCAPVAASYAYITRCFTRGEHTWIMSDGWDKFKENIKLGIILFIMDIVILVMGMNAISFYNALYVKSGLMMWQAFGGVMLMMLILYTFMHYYFYQIMVTFECSFKQLMKNAFICAVADLPMTIVCTLICLAVSIGLFFLINPAIVIVFDLVVGLCITRYPIEFHAARVLEKNMRNMKKRNESKKPKITYMSDGDK